MKDALKELFSSKKFLVTLATVLVAIGSKVGLAIDPQLVDQIVAIAAAYVVGQGIADHGSTAAQINADSAVKSAVALGSEP